MSVSKVLLLGGAALIFAACAETTSPGPDMHQAGSAAASVSKRPSVKPKTDGVSTTSTTCERGWVLSGRGDSVCGTQ